MLIGFYLWQNYKIRIDKLRNEFYNTFNGNKSINEICKGDVCVMGDGYLLGQEIAKNPIHLIWLIGALVILFWLAKRLDKWEYKRRYKKEKGLNSRNTRFYDEVGK